MEEFKYKELVIGVVIGLLVAVMVVPFFIEGEGNLTKKEYGSSKEKVKTLLDLVYQGDLSTIMSNTTNNIFFKKSVTDKLYAKRFNFKDKKVFRFYLGRFQNYKLDYKIKRVSITKGNVLDNLENSDAKTFLVVIELNAQSETSSANMSYVIPIYGVINEDGKIEEYGEL